MRPWPLPAYVAIAILITLSGISHYFIYTHTRESYRAVGFNDGQIHQREQTALKLEKLAVLQDCRALQSRPERNEFLSVKAKSIYIVRSPGSAVEFCQD